MMKTERIKGLVRKTLMMFFYYTRNRNKKSVFFYSFAGKQYSDSPRAISEYLHRIRPDLDIYWMINDEKNVPIPQYVKRIGLSPLNSYKIQAQANAWVFNSVVSDSTFKGKSTLYVQTFHGDRGFKKCGYDAENAMGDKYRKKRHKYIENDICNYWLSGSKYAEKNAYVSYGYAGKFLKFGSPRNDSLLNTDNMQEKIADIKKYLGIGEDVKVLLYAPTFRDYEKGEQEINIDINSCLNILSMDRRKWICLIRAHSSSRGLKTITSDNNLIIDVSDYYDMCDLLLVSDILITDYSSCACDFILTKKPVILAQFDHEYYIENSRALSVDAKEAGFLVAFNQDELNGFLSNINLIDFDLIQKKVDSYFGTYETGHALEETCKIISEWIK